MSEQLVAELAQDWGQPTLGNVPELDCAIVRRWRNLMVVKGIPFQVVNQARMADDFTSLKVDASRVEQGNDNERWVGFDGQEDGINGTNATTMAIAMNWNVGVAVLLRWAVDVTKLWRSHAAEPKLKCDIERKVQEKEV